MKRTMSLIAVLLCVLCAFCMTGCKAASEEVASEEVASETTEGFIGGYDKSSFLDSKFGKVKDVQWDPNQKTNSRVQNSGNCYLDDDNQTTDSWWTSGSYVTLALNNETVKAGTRLGNKDTTKDVPTFKVTLHTSSGADKGVHVLASKAHVVGICEEGVMIEYEAPSRSYGAFMYTKKGWTKANSGTSEIYVNYDYAYPTLAEMNAAIAKY